ncbi:MAG: HgcAB-associated protein HgcC [Fidelibacterota bacterium]
MDKEAKKIPSSGVTIGSCTIKVESLVTVDERGQMVLPKEIRDKFGIRGGDKLAIASCTDTEDNLTCLCAVKSDDFAVRIKDLLGPMLNEVVP